MSLYLKRLIYFSVTSSAQQNKCFRCSIIVNSVRNCYPPQCVKTCIALHRNFAVRTSINLATVTVYPANFIWAKWGGHSKCIMPRQELINYYGNNYEFKIQKRFRSFILPFVPVITESIKQVCRKKWFK